MTFQDILYNFHLEGQYDFTLHFTLRSLENNITICKVQPVYQLDRQSVNCKVNLEPRIYEVILNIIAERDNAFASVDKMIRLAIRINPSKLREIGKRYNSVHIKLGATEIQEAYNRAGSFMDHLPTTPLDIGVHLAGDSSISTPFTEYTIESDSDTGSSSSGE
ncbi:unnamed protein product [Fusarium graminearum]|uniref:Uncharacterized protein n=1 Tax=Gibberella zeae TaxID=5518 RepID=A0A9N8RR26_GIBZA|nr:unnamed protein product [Fusarium graminearum]